MKPSTNVVRRDGDKDNVVTPLSSDIHLDDDVIAPDGGWGWVVCAASFVINFIIDGTMFSFGVILLDLLDYFGESKSKTAWVGSVLLGVSMITGPMVSYLLHRFSCRQVTIFGTLLSTVAFVSSIFAPSVDVLIITYGIFGGIGFGMVFLPAIIIVGLYFNKRRAIATGIATSGSGVGIFAYGYICDRLLLAYAWRGTILILSGLVLNCLICAALFRPVVEEKLRKRYKSMKRSEVSSSDSSGYCGSSEQVFPKGSIVELSSDSLAPPGLQLGHADDLKTPYIFAGRLQPSQRLYKSAEHITLLNVNPAKPRLLSSSYNVNEFSNEVEMERIKRGLSRPILRKDIFYSGSVSQLPDFTRCGSLSSFLAQMTRETNSEETVSINRMSCWKGGCVKKVIDFTLFREVAFVFILIACTCWTVQAIPLTYVPDLAVSYGIHRSQAALLISIVGITNTLGRIVAGFVTDVFRVRSVILYTISLLTAATVNFIFPWCTTFPLLGACAALFGLCMAVAVSLRTIVIADHLGIEKLTSSFGVIAMFQGVAFTINPPIAGKLYDVSGSYVLPFVMAGSMYVISGFSALLLGLMKPRKNTGPEIIISVDCE